MIGVVTSPTGAVIRDILHRLADRFPGRVLVWPVLVQGQGSAGQVAAAVRGFSGLAEGGPIPRPDLVIVARGGGSIEDLWGFNEEEVVRAIAASHDPGDLRGGARDRHDAGRSRRRPPRADADRGGRMAVPVRAELVNQIAELALRKRRGQARVLNLARERLAARGDRLPAPQALLAAKAQRLDDLSERLRRGLAHRTEVARGRLARDAGALRPALLSNLARRAGERLAAVRLTPDAIQRRLAEAHTRLAALDRLRRSLDPRAPLARGYVLVTAPDGSVRQDPRSGGAARGAAAGVRRRRSGGVAERFRARPAPNQRQSRAICSERICIGRRGVAKSGPC